MDRSNPHIHQRLGVTLLVALLCASLVALWPASALADDDRPQLRVMTRNLYLGADLMPVAGVPTDQIPDAAAAVWAAVQATDFPTRSRAIAREVALTRPALIGLQEAALWHTGSLPAGPPVVAYDFLQILMNRLSERGLDYKVVVEQPTFNIAAPTGPNSYVSLTQRNVILARADLPPRKFRLSNPQQGLFDNYFSYPVGEDVVNDWRGWTSVDVRIHGRQFRFVNTHLDSFVPLIREAQAQELVAGPLAGPMRKVVVGDFNDTPDSLTLTTLRGSGLRDAWAATRRGPGYTYGQDPDLLNTRSKLYQRIDYVMASKGIGMLWTRRVGNTPLSRIDGLWPSDHAGVVATLRP
jgi:hypothetical protein